MKLWTVQPEEVYNELKNNNIYFCKEKQSPYLYNDDGTKENIFYNAYDWLAKKMTEIIGPPPENIHFPVWAWYRYDWQEKPFSLEEAAKDISNDKNYYLLEIEVPENEVLLSDFDAWHYVLNNWYIDDSMNEIESDKISNEFKKLPMQKQEELTKESWNKIFDISKFENDWKVQGRYVQATFWELKPKYIKSVQYIPPIDKKNELEDSYEEEI